MKQADWLTCSEVGRMLPLVRHRLSERKLRLLACACCRRVWYLLSSERSRRAVALAERHADGLVDGTRLHALGLSPGDAHSPSPGRGCGSAWDARGLSPGASPS